MLLLPRNVPRITSALAFEICVILHQMSCCYDACVLFILPVWFSPWTLLSSSTPARCVCSKLHLFLAVHLHRPNQRQFPWHLHTNPKESFAYMHKTVKHSNEHTFVGMVENLDGVVLCFFFFFSGCVFTNLLSFSPDYSKRVYQGVRVKHTVKDLLAEKRSRQTSGPRYSVSTISSKLLRFCPVPSHFICLPNQTAQPQLTFCWATQLRGTFFFLEISSPCLHFGLFCGPTIHGWSIDRLRPPPPLSLLPSSACKANL